MSVRKVLAPLIGGPNDGATLFTAITISKGLKAHLEACFVRPDPEDALPYPEMEGGDLKEIRQAHRRHAEVTGKKPAVKSHRQFNAACKKNSIARAKHPSEAHDASTHWDASARAVRAVGAAAAFLEDAERILVLSAEDTYEETADAQRLVEYLAWHGVGVEGQALKKGRGAAAQALLTAARDFAADLMVMGGHVHNRFDEVVFGGATRHALRHAQIPPLMMH